MINLDKGLIFQKFDFGKTKNLKEYKSEKPPQYQLENLPNSIPIRGIVGREDPLASVKNAENLLKVLTEKKRNYKQTIIENCDHLTFMIGKEGTMEKVNN